MNTRKLILAGVLLCLAAPAWAQQDIDGSKDNPLISRYPGSFIVRYDQKEFDEYDLPVGKSKSDGTPTAKHLEGKVTVIRYEYPHERSDLEVYRNYQQALQRAGFQEVFQCVDADGCGPGSSHDTLGFWGGWHNRYLAMKLSRPEGDVYAAVNLVQDQQHFVFLVIVEVKPMEGGLITVDATSLENDITRTGHASVYGIYFDTGKADVKPESDGALKEIAKLLQKDAALKLYVVGHTDNVGAFASNMDLSKRRGDAVVKVLLTKYSVAVARLSAQGDGPTAPVASNDSEDGRAKNRRVELVKQ